MTRDVINFQKEAGDPGLRLVSDNVDIPEPTPIKKQFVNFMFLKVGTDWRKLDSETKGTYKQEFLELFEPFRSEFLLFSYSLVGFDSKADLMLWRIGDSLDMVQDMTARMYRSHFGSFMETVDNYLSVTKGMMFIDGSVEDRSRVEAGTGKYHFIYPCVKNLDWYEMPDAERDALIEENFMVGRRFPNIKIHLTHAFGFNDYEYLISFETDEPKDFLALAEELREAPASRFTLRGMPVYTCRQRSLIECLDALG